MSIHERMVERMADPDACPLIAAAGGERFHELANHIALQLDDVGGPWRGNRGLALTGHHVLIALMSVGIVPRRMSEDEHEELWGAYDEVLAEVDAEEAEGS